MGKNEKPHKRTCSRNLKKIFACMLSLAMIPANGITTFASSKQGTTQTKSVKRSVKSTDAKRKWYNT